MSRLWTKAWIIVAAGCVGLSVYEIPNAKLIWRYVRAVTWRDRYTPGGKLNIPAVVTDKLVAADPEAGDMLRYCLKYYSDDADIDDLAVLVRKYPRNEFFLAQLAEELSRNAVIDSRAASLMVDRLLELNGDNAHYRYLKGWILLTDPNRPDHLQEALDQFELGHRLPRFYLPYTKYKERLDRLYKTTALFWERQRLDLRSFYMDLARRVFQPVGLRGRLDDGTFADLSASVVGIADRVIENAYDPETLVAGAILLRPGIRLRDLDLPEAEARQSRLRLARGLTMLAIHGQLFESDINAALNVFCVLCIPPVLFMAALAFLVGMVMEFNQARPRWPKPVALRHVKTLILIDAGLVSVLILLVVLALPKERPEGKFPGFLLFVAAIFASWNALWLSSIYPVIPASLRRPRLWLAALCGSLWFKGAVLWTAGSLSVSMPDNLAGWLRYGGILLAWSFFCALIWTEAAYRSDALTSRRRRGSVLMTYWVVVLMACHIFALVCARMDRLTADPLAQYRPFPEATQETYDRVILGRRAAGASSDRGPRAGVPGRIEYAAPNDLRAFIASRRAAGETISDGHLRKLLRNCNRDLRSILLDELADPNVYDVLVIRASWGDRSVAAPLERIYGERLDVFHESEPEPPPRHPSSLGELLDLAGTLAWISDGPEGQDRLAYLLEYVVERTRDLGVGPSLTDPRHAERIMLPFWEALGKLPAGYATKLVKSYLRQTRYVDLFGDRGRDIGELAALLADGDRELAEEIVAALAQSLVAPEPTDASATESVRTHNMSLARYRWQNSPYCLEAVFGHLNAESIPLLLEYLNSDNDQLRAFIVWRLTSLGYEFPSDRLQVLRKDIDWKVRLNTLFVCGPDDLAKALDDESAVVRIVAHMLKSE